MPLLQTKYGLTKQYDKPLFLNPNSVQEVFSVKSIDSIGTFELNEKRFSQSFVLSDVNFEGMTDAEQKEMIINFSKVLSGIPCRFSYTVANEYVDKKEFDKKILFKLMGDAADELRVSFNEVINDRVSTAKQGLYQTIYLTPTIQCENIREAKTAFANIEATLRSSFIQIGLNGMAGSSVRPVEINERMQNWYNFTHAGKKSNYKFDYYKNIELRKDWRDIVSAEKIDFYSDYFVLNKAIYGRVMYISEYSKTLDSGIISELSKINCTSYITVNTEPIDTSAYKDEITRKYSKVGMKIEKEKDRNRNKNDFLAEVSDKLSREKKMLDNLTEQIETEDDNYFNTTILIMFLTDSEEDLETITEKVTTAAALKSCVVKPCFDKQREGMNSAYMFGIQEFKRVCNFSATNLAMFMPYKTQELNDENGLYYGINQLSQNPILADRKKLDTKHGVVLGMSRKGKSVFSKIEMMETCIKNPEDQVIVVDPQNEYSDVAYAPGIDGSVISFNSQEKTFVNPMDVNFEGVDYAMLQDIIEEKTDFILTLLASCMRRTLDAEEQGIIDDIVEQIYSENYAMRRSLNGEDSQITEYSIPNYMKVDRELVPASSILTPEEQERMYSPMLQDVYQKLLDRKQPVSNKLAAHMQIFVNGSLNLFNHRTNVELKKRFLVFNLSGIKDNIKTPAMVAMLQIIKNKFAENYAAGNWTFPYIDELHELLAIPTVADFVIKLWKESGKLKCILTGITQNMTDLIEKSPDKSKIAAILSNSQYFVLFAQSSIDRRLLEEFLPFISTAMFNYVEEAAAGTGLLRMGSVTLPFDARMSKDSMIFKIVNTDGEKKQVAI